MPDEKQTHTPEPEVPLNTARGQRGGRLEPVGPDGTAPAGAQMPPQDAEVLSHTLPSRQDFARDFLAGKTSGLMERLAPNAKVSGVEGWVEDDETIDRLARWHRESPDG